MSQSPIELPVSKPTDLSRAAWKAGRVAGQASFYGEVANQAANAICGLYGKSPSSFLRVVPVGSGFIDNNKGFLDDLCEGVAPLPPPPEQKFSGGQCDGERYRINFSVRLRAPAVNGVSPAPRTASYEVYVWGAIADIRLGDYVDEVSPPFRYQGYKRLECICRGDGGLPGAAGQNIAILGSSSAEIQSIVSLNVTKFNRSPDTCGNPSPVYPPISRNPTDYDKTVDFRISPTVSVPVNVSISPTVVVAAGVFSPEFNVNVGGINVTLSAGGFTFSPTVEIPVGVSFPIGDPRVNVSPTFSIDTASKKCADDIDVLEILKRIRELKLEVLECCERDNPFEPPDADRVVVTELGVHSSGLFDLPKRTFQIAVRLTKTLPNEKKQPGGNAPDVLYCGWCWFGAANNMSERMPIDSEFKLYSPKEWISNTFGFTLYTGYAARITAYSMTKKTVGE